MNNMSLVLDLFEDNADYTEGLKLSCDDALSLRYAASVAISLSQFSYPCLSRHILVPVAISLSLTDLLVRTQCGRHGRGSGGV